VSSVGLWATALATPGLAQTTTQPSAERVADLLRLWNYVRLFDVDERAMGPAWQAALAEAAQPALEAQDDKALQAVADRMMARIDPPHPAISPASAAARTTPGFRVVGGYAVASCAPIADAVGKKPTQISGDAKAFAAAIKKRGAIILDCRNFPAGEEGYRLAYVFDQWFPDAIAEYLSQPVLRGAIRLRLHDGYPPDRGGTSGQYVRGTFDQSLGELKAERSAKAPRIKLLFLLDGSSPDLRGFVGGLQASRQARVLADGPLINDDQGSFQSKHVHALVRTGTYIYPTRRVGWTPDACLGQRSNDALVMKTAVVMLGGAKGPACPLGARPAPRPAASAPSTDDGGVPSLGERMVALAKLWGTFEYFHPYTSLDSRPWETELEEFVPVFAAANSRSAYEDAVARLSARADDSHVRVLGLKDGPFGSARFVPPFSIRPVEGRFLVSNVRDSALVPRVHDADEIIAVDGVPASDVAARLAPLIAASTPQWMAQMQAGFLLSGLKADSVRLTLRRGDSPPFDVVVPRFRPASGADQAASKEPSFHLIGSDIGYINMEQLAPSDANRAIDEFIHTRAIIFDLRGYPQGTGWTLAPRLALPGRDEAVNAQFRRPIYIGPSDPQEQWKSFSQRLARTDKPHYRGKVIVLIDAKAISQSEHTAMMFEAAANPVFVGTPTAGANGDVTTVALPGGLFVTFTGHDVRHADGRQLQRVGIQPTVTVEPTVKGLQAGRDEVLEAGLAIARQP
jgi:C-terminal processing protease CtpA/Prc